MLSQTLLLGLVVSTSVLYEPLFRRAKVFGILRNWESTGNIHGHDVKIIANTPHAEDLHYHEPSGLIFTAAEPNADRRSAWFPAMAAFDDFDTAGEQGSILAIDSRTSVAKKLELLNFSGPFVTHGIDIWSSPLEPNTLYIIAVNHLPNPEYSAASNPSVPQARSRVEIFQHKLGSASATHLRSVWHPLIRTPNDIFAVSSTEFYVTNDHYYRDGPLRIAEDFGLPVFSTKTDLVHISVSSLAASDDTEGVTATVAIKGLKNNNGLGHGSSRDEIVIGLAAPGAIEIARRVANGPQLEVTHSIQLESTLDNPSYFHDKYAKGVEEDASGYVLAGLTRAIEWPSPHLNPMRVWLVQPVPGSDKSSPTWTKKIIFQDDGNLISSASTAVLVPINPDKNGGKKQARLFISGPISTAAVSTTIDL